MRLALLLGGTQCFAHARLNLGNSSSKETLAAHASDPAHGVRRKGNVTTGGDGLLWPDIPPLPEGTEAVDE
eukprot:6193447-Prymnesium_polylepis.1